MNVFLWMTLILPMTHGKQTTERIRNLEEGSIKKIIVRKQSGGDIIGVIEEDKVLNRSYNSQKTSEPIRQEI